MPDAAQIGVVGVGIRSGERRRRRRRLGGEPLCEGGGNLPGDFILHGQYVGQLPAVAFAPQRRIIARVDKAHVNPHLAVSALHRTSDNEPDSKLARDIAEGRLVPICESAVRRDHPQPSNSPQLRRDRLRNAIGKILVAATDRTEWKHSH